MNIVEHDLSEYVSDDKTKKPAHLYDKNDFINAHQNIGGEPKSFEQLISEHQLIGGPPRSAEEIINSHQLIGLPS